MVDYNAPRFQHPRETWTVKQCEKAAKHTAKDGMGTPYPFKGRVHFGHYAHGMVVRYNGGTVIDGKWWQGEEWHLPLLPEGFQIVVVPTWGHRIIKTPACKA